VVKIPLIKRIVAKREGAITLTESDLLIEQNAADDKTNSRYLTTAGQFWC
jgi:hypothetical protein